MKPFQIAAEKRGIRSLLSLAGDQAKLRKTQGLFERVRIIYLALSPASISGHNVCPESGSCESVCVGSATGLAAVFSSILESRIRKTRFYFEDRANFLAMLCNELERHQERAENDGVDLCCRLNTSSDLDWFGIVRQFPGIMFWDYCKANQLKRHRRVLDGGFENYHITFSWSESPRHQRNCQQILDEGGNVARVFGIPGPGYTGPWAMRQPLPKTWEGFRVIDGDTHDLRLYDDRAKPGRPGYIVGLRMKSANNAQRAESFASGFATAFEG